MLQFFFRKTDCFDFIGRLRLFVINTFYRKLKLLNMQNKHRKFLIVLITLSFLMTVSTYAQVKPDMAQPDFGQYEVLIQKDNLKVSDPNFAGKYVLSNWSCGKGCFRFAIIAAETGKVFFPKQLQNVKGDSAEKLIDFRNDSILLVLNESLANKMQKKTFFIWTRDTLDKITTTTERESVAQTFDGIVLPIFTAISSKVISESEVPLRLPKAIPSPKFLPKLIPMAEGATEISFYSSVQKLGKDEYDLTIDITPDCAGRPNCNYARLIGIKNSAKTPVDSSFIKYVADSAKSVDLANNIKGFYTPAPTNPKSIYGANIFWMDGMGSQYIVSIKRGSMEQMIELANSVIANSENIYKPL